MTSSLFFFLFVPLLAFILLAINFIFAPHNPYQEKNGAFECGFTSFLGQNRTQFSISFFIFALLFLLFDLEILLVYPYLVSSYTNESYGLVILLIFLAALTLGFVFELGKKALTIDSRQTLHKKITVTQINAAWLFNYNKIIVYIVNYVISYIKSFIRSKISTFVTGIAKNYWIKICNSCFITKLVNKPIFYSLKALTIWVVCVTIVSFVSILVCIYKFNGPEDYPIMLELLILIIVFVYLEFSKTLKNYPKTRAILSRLVSALIYIKGGILLTNIILKMLPWGNNDIGIGGPGQDGSSGGGPNPPGPNGPDWCPYGDNRREPTPGGESKGERRKRIKRNNKLARESARYMDMETVNGLNKHNIAWWEETCLDKRQTMNDRFESHVQNLRRRLDAAPINISKSKDCYPRDEIQCEYFTSKELLDVHKAALRHQKLARGKSKMSLGNITN